MSFIVSMLSSGEDPLIILFAIVSFFIAITVGIVFHEVAHGYAALWNGDRTAKNNGRLSFNPVKHFDPVGFLMLALVGFGFAKPVPVNPYNFKKPKKGLIMVSMAGIVTNFIIALLFMFIYALIWFIARNTDMMYSDAGSYAFAFFDLLCYFMVIININLMLFNLLPLGALDGLKILEAFTKRGNRLVNFLRANGMYILLALVGLSLISGWFYEFAPEIFIYMDVLGLYLMYGRYFIAGGITSLFTMMFGLDTLGFWLFSIFPLPVPI